MDSQIVLFSLECFTLTQLASLFAKTSQNSVEHSSEQEVHTVHRSFNIRV